MVSIRGRHMSEGGNVSIQASMGLGLYNYVVLCMRMLVVKEAYK